MRAARPWLLPRDAPSCLVNTANSKFADNSRRLRRQLQVAPQRPPTSGPSRVASRCSLKQPWTTTSRIRRWTRTSSTTVLPMMRTVWHWWQAMAATAAPVLLTRPAVEAPRAAAAEAAAEAAAGGGGKARRARLRRCPAGRRPGRRVVRQAQLWTRIASRFGGLERFEQRSRHLQDLLHGLLRPVGLAADEFPRGLLEPVAWHVP